MPTFTGLSQKMAWWKSEGFDKYTREVFVDTQSLTPKYRKGQVHATPDAHCFKVTPFHV